MKEENNRESKNKWTRIFQKKWFFPALYLTLAVVLLSGIVWFQNVNKAEPDAEPAGGGMEEYDPNLYGEDAEPVTQQEESIRMPVADEEKAEIVTTFFDSDASEEERANSLIHYNNRYYQNEGVAIASTEETSFDVIASLSGTVEGVKEDPLLGNVVTLSHEDDIKTYYASLEEVVVKEGDTLEQGDLIGNAGENLLGQENGTHVHFEILRNGEKQNPEKLFDQPVSSIGAEDDEQDSEDQVSEEQGSEDEESEASTSNEDEEDAEQDEQDEQEEDEDEEEDTEDGEEPPASEDSNQ